jgi:hypothetical protein
MNCQDYHDSLQRFLDGDGPGDEEPRAEHLAQCADCRSWHAAALRLAAGLRRLPSPLPPAGLTDRVVAQVLAERRERSAWRRRLTTLALAASLLLASLGGYALWSRLASGGRQPPDSVPEESGGSRPPLAQAPSLRESVTEVGALVTSLGRRTMDQSRPLWPVMLPPGFDELNFEQPLEPPAQGLLEAGQGVATGLEPVADSARRALDLFRREVPHLSLSGKQG